MSNKLKTKVDALVGEYNWYIVGGGAAYWHIENYAQFGPRDLHDMDYYESIHKLIFPSDIEGNAVKTVDFFFEGQYKVIPVTLQEMSKEEFELSRLDKLDGMYVLKKDAIIKQYEIGGSVPEKLEKRKTRIALLKIIQQNLAITKANVEANKPPLTMAEQIAEGIKLKPTKTNNT